jgi:glutamate dehydrogenase
MREVQLVRAYISYWRQAGSKFSVRYMAETLRVQPAWCANWSTAFKLRFDPRCREEAARAPAVPSWPR